MTSTTRPAIGARLTWTSSGDRKIDTRVDGPTNGSTASSTPSTRPSAGESTPFETTGISRSGSRKKPSDAAEAALIEEVDDELHLVHALEVGDLGLVAGLDERFERGLDQVRDAAAERRLLAEQIGLRLLLE